YVSVQDLPYELSWVEGVSGYVFKEDKISYWVKLNDGDELKVSFPVHNLDTHSDEDMKVLFDQYYWLKDSISGAMAGENTAVEQDGSGNPDKLDPRP
ncbi:MAG: hypothetical protein KJT03_06905, partial [Verrucomicrobiae bacterium]|nr:hypothetical protein [Verrucomicrobiae bacterium]